MKNNKLIKSFFLIFFLFAAKPALAKLVTDEAQEIYKGHQQSVYQIQVVDLATGKKSAIGSGFCISPEGYIATNFHVVSSAVNKPKLYRVELVREDNTTEVLTIEHIDVVHDLAIIKSPQKLEHYLLPGEASLQKGERIFAMGNPHDLGMTIIEGTYNGLMKTSLYKKILFSGSLNPGMSGGPALNHDGKVIGVNVATAGNQISFLVPVEHLNVLFAEVVEHKRELSGMWKDVIQMQLWENQKDYMERLISSEWDTIPIGDAMVPGEISGVFKCWGDSKDSKENLYTYSYMDCSTDDSLFLSPTLNTGQIHYRYHWVTSKGLNTFRFYKLYQNYFSYPMEFNNAAKQDVTNFFCQNNFVKVGGEDWKVALCARSYKKYSALYDINLSMASVHERQKGLLVDVAALGVTKAHALKFIAKFLKVIQWKK